jgi:regulator of replication initiation timing
MLTEENAALKLQLKKLQANCDKEKARSKELQNAMKELRLENHHLDQRLHALAPSIADEETAAPTDPM